MSWSHFPVSPVLEIIWILYLKERMIGTRRSIVLFNAVTAIAGVFSEVRVVGMIIHYYK